MNHPVIVRMKSAGSSVIMKGGTIVSVLEKGKGHTKDITETVPFVLTTSYL